MTDTTRRGFLGLLAKVPGIAFCVGVFVRQAGAGISAPASLQPLCKNESGPRRKGRWLNESDGLGGESCRPLTENEQLIRWIPVSERLPERDDKSKSDSIDGLQSRRVQIVTDLGYVDIASLILTEWGEEFSCGFDLMSYTLRAVTHWAELPSPPTAEPPA